LADQDESAYERALRLAPRAVHLDGSPKDRTRWRAHWIAVKQATGWGDDMQKVYVTSISYIQDDAEYLSAAEETRQRHAGTPADGDGQGATDLEDELASLAIRIVLDRILHPRR
jgi:hypothetical protein